jgi:hypothetical protein
MFCGSNLLLLEIYGRKSAISCTYKQWNKNIKVKGNNLKISNEKDWNYLEYVLIRYFYTCFKYITYQTSWHFRNIVILQIFELINCTAKKRPQLWMFAKDKELKWYVFSPQGCSWNASVWFEILFCELFWDHLKERYSILAGYQKLKKQQ